MRRTTHIEILHRIINRSSYMFSKSAARSLLSLSFSIQDRDRMNLLAEKSRSGEATMAENSELEDYLFVGNLLAIIHSKARRSLNEKSATQ